MIGDACVVYVFLDKKGIVYNVEIAVTPKFDGSKKQKPQAIFELWRHVSKLMVVVPVDECKQALDQYSLAEEDSNIKTAGTLTTQSDLV